MEKRLAKGILLARQGRVVYVRLWGNAVVAMVRSGGDVYRVVLSLDGRRYSCTCPDFALRRRPCKHVYAAAYAAERLLGRNLLHHLVSESRVPHRSRYRSERGGA